jgi:Tol biopolymer transport system component
MASRFESGAWQPAAALVFSTGEFRDVDPFVAGDRLYLYASQLRAGRWSTARHLAALSSPSADLAPAFSPDGNYLFFTSERPGMAPAPASGRPPGDIYQVDIAALGLSR